MRRASYDAFDKDGTMQVRAFQTYRRLCIRCTGQNALYQYHANDRGSRDAQISYCHDTDSWWMVGACEVSLEGTHALLRKARLDANEHKESGSMDQLMVQNCVRPQR